jgi:hypothetical protein
VGQTLDDMHDCIVDAGEVLDLEFPFGEENGGDWRPKFYLWVRSSWWAKRFMLLWASRRAMRRPASLGLSATRTPPSEG